MTDSRVVFVAGATGNLGKSAANAFLKSGAAVVLMDRSSDRLKDSFPDLVDSDKHMVLPCSDMANPEIFSDCVEKAISRYGRIDVLVTVVGGYYAGAPLHETPVEKLDFMLMLNARTLFVGAKTIIPHMIENGSGKIVAVGARTSLVGQKNMAAYSAAKAATIRLVESMAAELKDHNINVNAVIPGTMDTPQNRSASPGADFTKWVKTDSVADVICFLASDAARDISGVSIPVYGRT